MSKPTLSESEYLKKQADEAQRAILHTLESIKSDLLQGADIRPLARKHPLMTVGAAAGVGFLAGWLVWPSGSKKPAHSQKIAEEEVPPSAAPRSGKDRSRRSPGAWFMRQLVRQLRPLMLSVLTAAYHHYAARPSGSNGAVEPASDPTPRTVPADERAGDPSI